MNVELARWQFGFVTVNHFFFVPVTIGLAFLTALLQTAWYRSKRDEYLRLTRFFGTLLVINVAIGVVTGLVQEFQFGMNGGRTRGWWGTSSARRWRWRGWPRSSWNPRSWGCGCSAGTSYPSGSTC